MVFGKVEAEAGKIHSFADLVGSLARRCQGSLDELAHRFKISPLTAVRFHFDPLKFRSFIVALEDRSIRHLATTMSGGVRRVRISNFVQTCAPCSIWVVNQCQAMTMY